MTSRNETYRHIGKASAVIIALTVLDKVLAISKEVIVADRFGISPVLDAFNIAYALPGVVVLLFSGALTSAFVPLYVEWSHRLPEKEANAHAAGLIFISTIFFTLVTGLCFVFSPVIFSLIGYGFGVQQKSMGVAMERFLVLLILIDGVNVLLAGLLQARKRFFAIRAAPLFVNIVSILLLLFLYERLGIYTLVWGFLLGAGCKSIYLGQVIRRAGFRFVFPRKFDREKIRAFFRLALPLLGSELIANVNILIDQVMATSLDAGSVSTLRYAYRINDMPIQIVIMAITLAIFPYISEHACNRDYGELRHYFTHAVILLAFLTLPIIAMVCLFSQEVVGILFHHGAFGLRAKSLTADVLLFYSFGLFFLAYSFINGAFFSALKNTRPMLWMGFLSIGLNVGFNLAFMHLFGVRGIALSTTATLGIVAFCFMGMLRRRIGIGFQRIFVNFWRFGAAMAVMLIIGTALRGRFVAAGAAPVVYLPVTVAVICCCYLGVCWVLRTEEIDFFIDLFRGKAG